MQIRTYESRLAANLPKLAAVRLLFWMHFFAAIIVPFFTVWGGLSLSTVFELNTWFFFCNVLFEVPTGALADRIGRKPSLVLGCLFASVGISLYTIAPDVRLFYAGETLLAAGFALQSGADEALAFESLRALGKLNETGVILRRLETFRLIGVLASALAGSFLASHFGLQVPLWCTGAAALAAALVALTLVEPAERSLTSRRPFLATLRDGAHFFAAQPGARRLVFDTSIATAMGWALFWLSQPLLQRADMSLAWVGGVFAAMQAVQMVFLRALPRLEQRAGSRRRLILGMTAAAAIAFAVLALTAFTPAVILALLVGAAVTTPQAVLCATEVHPLVPNEQRATVMSFASMMRQLAKFALSPLLGLLADRTLPGLAALLAGGLAALVVWMHVRDGRLIAAWSWVSLRAKSVRSTASTWWL